LIRPRSITLAGLLVATLAAPLTAGIRVTSYSTTALTNGFAPSLQGPYFAQQTLDNVTPALAQVSGDWTGPNADGTPDTWHFVGTSQASSTTTFDANSYTVTAAGSFQYRLDTTGDFIDPSSSSIFGPGGAANYDALFDTDLLTTYSVSAQLNQRGRLRLTSFSGLVVFDQSNPTVNPILVNLLGTMPPGRYNFQATTGVGAPNFPNGINHFEAGGSYENVVFTVRVPEPCPLGAGVAIVLGLMPRRVLCAHARELL
jgi:hypothetical protein